MDFLGNLFFTPLLLVLSLVLVCFGYIYYRIYFGPKPFLFTTDLDMIREVGVKQFDKFVNRLTPNSGFKFIVNGEGFDSLFTSSDEEWRRRRQHTTPAFTAKKLQQMEPIITESTARLTKVIFDQGRNGKAIDATELYLKFSLEVILSTSFGRSLDIIGGKGGQIYADAQDIFSLTGEGGVLMKIAMFLQISVPILAPVLEPFLKRTSAFKAVDRLGTAGIKMINIKRQAGKESQRRDLLQLLVESSDEGRATGGSTLSTGEIVAGMIDFLSGASDTTSASMSFVTFALATYPEVQERLFAEIEAFVEEFPDKSMYNMTQELEYLDMVVSEGLRRYSPSAGTMRICNKECVINGVTIKPEVQVYFATRAVMMDPAVYPDPDTFIPERFSPEEKASRHPCAYHPFGVGPRRCVGMNFALMEAKMALIEIVRNFRIHLAPKTKIPLEMAHGVTMKPKAGSLGVVFLPRQPQ